MSKSIAECTAFCLLDKGSTEDSLSVLLIYFNWSNLLRHIGCSIVNSRRSISMQISINSGDVMISLLGDLPLLGDLEAGLPLPASGLAVGKCSTKVGVPLLLVVVQ